MAISYCSLNGSPSVNVANLKKSFSLVNWSIGLLICNPHYSFLDKIRHIVFLADRLNIISVIMNSYAHSVCDFNKMH